jgi:signal transduction histidine kinase
MGTRPKILLLFMMFGIIPVVVLSVVNYRQGVRTVEAGLRGELERQARGVAREVSNNLREREDALIALARSRALRDYVRDEGQRLQSHLSRPTFLNFAPASEAASADEQIPVEVRAEVRAFLQSGQHYYVAVACLAANKEPLFRAELNKGEGDEPVRFQTRGFLSENIRTDEHIWSSGEQTPLRSAIMRGTSGSTLRYTLPIFLEAENASAARGVLIVDFRLDGLLNDAVSNVVDPSLTNSSESSPSSRMVVILDRRGDAVYHSNVTRRYQPAAKAVPPSFEPLARAMNEGRGGWGVYESSEGDDWIGAYQPLAPLELSVAVAGDYSAAVRGLRWWGWLSIGLIVLIGAVAAALLLLYLHRTVSSIKRVTAGAVAIAGGNLNQRIEVSSSDETRLLAETFNAMSDRLREQIAREAESRQFESFMRLSAMLTHDLKNSIQALSLIVGNMEQQFHREEFRADAMQSLRDATSQLSALVAKLSEPIRSLSGEFKRPHPVDLVPLIRRALSRMATPHADMHQLDVQLPASLVAIADEERIERVVENLVLNALQAMALKEGELKISAGPAEDGFVFFSVSDTGPGMTEEFQRTRLFRPFNTTKAKGVGLGLYTCRELVRALGGRIEVESSRGSGTCFRVVLPSGTITEADQKSSGTE